MTAVAIALGIFGPLLAAGGSRALIQRTGSDRARQLTPLLMKLFAAKMVFFGAYVTAVIKLVEAPPAAFAISFTMAFIVLHLVEAFALRRASATI
jgi:hypothetical protein